MKRFLLLAAGMTMVASAASATPGTTTSPTGGALPSGVSAVGGVVIDLKGLNGNRIVSQVAAGTEYVGTAPASAYPLLFATQTGFTNSVVSALGGGIASASFRITLYDGDSQVGNFDYNQNFLLVNGINFGNFSTVATEQTDGLGVTTLSSGLGFGDDILDTGFFSSTNSALLSSFYATLVTGAAGSGQVLFRLNDLTPGDQFFDFTQGVDSSLLNVGSGPVVAPPVVSGAAPEPGTWAMMVVGFGLAGFALRRRVRASEVKFDAKIKRITEGAIA